MATPLARRLVNARPAILVPPTLGAVCSAVPAAYSPLPDTVGSAHRTRHDTEGQGDALSWHEDVPRILRGARGASGVALAGIFRMLPGLRCVPMDVQPSQAVDEEGALLISEIVPPRVHGIPEDGAVHVRLLLLLPAPWPRHRFSPCVDLATDFRAVAHSGVESTR